MAFYYKVIARGFFNDKLYAPNSARDKVVVEKKFDKCPSWLVPMETPKTTKPDAQKAPAKRKAPAKKNAPAANKTVKKKSIKDVKMDVKEDDLQVI